MNHAAKVLKAELDPKPSRLFKAVQMRYGKNKVDKMFAWNEKNAERKKLAVINALKDRCISYGFTGNNNIAACI